MAAAVHATFPDQPTYDVKVRAVFDEFDAKKTRAVPAESFATTLDRLAVSLPASTVRQLFAQADSNCDEHITAPEWHRFAEQYPTLLDCLYYRAKDYWTNQLQRDGTEKAALAARALREAEDAAAAAHAAAQGATDDAASALQLQMQRTADAEARALAAGDDEAAASRAAVDAQAEVAVRTAALGGARDTERGANQAAAEAQQAAAAAARAAAAREPQRGMAEERLREVERLLSEQLAVVREGQDDVARARDLQRSCEARGREAAAIQADASQALRDAADAVAAAEAALAARQGGVREAGVRRADAARAEAEQRRAGDAGAALLEAARAAEAARLAEAGEAGRRVEAAEEELRRQRQEEQGFVDTRASVNEQEAPLIDREVQLRAERHALESNESRLVSDFVAYTGRGAAVVPAAAATPVSAAAPVAAAPVVSAAPPALAIQRLSTASPRCGRPAPVQSPACRVRGAGGAGALTPRAAVGVPSLTPAVGAAGEAAAAHHA